jgi:hypothetical protein
MGLYRYAGAERPRSREAEPPLIDNTIPLLEAENARLRATIKRLEGALCCAAKLLRPYADKAE